jgi:hypothetical protein
MKNSTMMKGKFKEIHDKNQDLYYKMIWLIKQDKTAVSNEVITNEEDVEAQIDCLVFYGSTSNDESDLKKKVKKLILDVRTRWNSSFAMIQRFLSVQLEVKQYMEWYFLPSTQRDYFSQNKTKLDDITNRDWAILLGVAYLLQPFAIATCELSADKESTMSGVAPTLNLLANFLRREGLFDKPADKNPRPGQCKYKHILYEQHEGRPYFPEVVELLNAAQEHIRTSFIKKFDPVLAYKDGRRGDIAWTTLLNPKEYTDWILHEEWEDNDDIIVMLRKDFEDEVFKIASLNQKQKQKNADHHRQVNEFLNVWDKADDGEENVTGTVRKTPVRSLGRKLANLYSPEKNTGSHASTAATATTAETSNAKPAAKQRDRLKFTVHNECMQYFEDLSCDIHLFGEFRDFNLLQYWKNKMELSKYYWVRKCAQKWLAVLSMSTPSERVWSICGIIDDNRRGRLDGQKLEAQAMIHNNYHNLSDHHQVIQIESIKKWEEKCAAKREARARARAVTVAAAAAAVKKNNN